ncbi:MAG: lysophospholipid acyltransferase family protein, partial [Bacilli bacterium]
GTRIKKIGFDKLPKDGHYMITFNHISNFDPMIIMDVLKKYNIICISKKENLKTPIMGAFIQKAGYIPIDRQDLRQTLKMFRKAVHYSQDLNYSICVAPEGTRSKTLELLPFHSGTYRLPLKAEMGIIEIYLENTNLIHKNFPFKLTKVKMEVMDIIEYDSIKDDCTQTIAENARDRYVQTIKKREEQTK